MFGVLQDWIEVQGHGPDSLAQSGSSWAPLEGMQDITLWLEVRFAEGVAQLHYETALALEPGLFTEMASVTPSASATPVITRIVLSQNPTLPPCGLVRWRFTCVDGPWRVTFRITYSAKAGR